MIKLAILGCGNMGRFVMRNLGSDEFREFRLTTISALPSEEAALREFAHRYDCSYTLDPAALADPALDLVLEAAHPDAVRQYAPAILRAGVNMVAMSVGAFADSEFLAEARSAAESGKVRLLLPTGGIAGLDNLKAARLAGIEEAVLTMTKGPQALAGAPYFQTHPRWICRPSMNRRWCSRGPRRRRSWGSRRT